MLWYLDTSGLNALADDPDRDFLVHGILATGRVRTSSIVVMEAAATAHAARRLDLLRLLNRITEGSEPLEFPDFVFRRHVNTLAHHDRGVSLAVVSPDTSWNALRWPEDVSDVTSAEAMAFLLRVDEWFDEIATRTRATVQHLMRTGQATKLKSVKETFRYLYAPGRLYSDFVALSYRNCTGQEPGPALAELLPSDSVVGLYFGMFAYALHQRTVRESHHGRRRHAGAADLGQAIYLPFVHRFVTDDAAQYRAVRFLKRVVECRSCEVLRYSTFRSRLLPLS